MVDKYCRHLTLEPSKCCKSLVFKCLKSPMGMKLAVSVVRYEFEDACNCRAYTASACTMHTRTTKFKGTSVCMRLNLI